MRLSSAVIVVLLGLFNFSCQSGSSAALLDNDPPPGNGSRNNGQPSPVLVELFTSEGCSSCPPADRALMFLDKEQPVTGAQIIALELHVDYWDGPAWKDPFSSALFSQRQSLYAERYHSDQIYTPQMIVDGGQQFIGSDTLQATNVIMEASKKAKANVTLTADKEKLQIKISDIPKVENSTVFLALAEDNLNTDIKGGENSGRKLSHSAVVRELRSIGAITGESKSFETETELGLQKEWKKDDLKVVVFVQENESRRVFAAGQLKLAQKK
jgi:hypothetical protein